MLLLLALGLAAQPKTDFPALKQRLQRGNYAEARAGFEAILKEKNPPVSGIRWPGAVLSGRGHYFGRSRHARRRAQGSRRRTIPARPAGRPLLLRSASGTMRRRTPRPPSRNTRRTSSHGGSASASSATRATSPRPTRRCAGSSRRTPTPAPRERTSPIRNSSSSIGLAGAENARWNNKPSAVRLHPERGLQGRAQVRPGLLASRGPGRFPPPGEAQPRRRGRCLRQGAEDQPAARSRHSLARGCSRWRSSIPPPPAGSRIRRSR